MDVLRLNVLLVDEDSHLLEKMSSILNENGFTTACAQNKEEALRLIEHEQFDVLVTDLTMPDNDGVFLSKLLCKRLPVVMLQGNHDEESLKKLESISCCLLDKNELSTRLAKATWTAFKRFKIDQQITRDAVAA